MGVEDATEKRIEVAPVAPFCVATESLAYGEEVPTPRLSLGYEVYSTPVLFLVKGTVESAASASVGRRNARSTEKIYLRFFILVEAHNG